MTQIFVLQLRLGATIEEVLDTARSSVHAASRDLLKRTQSESDSEVQRYGSLLRAWHRETPYLSKEGFPRPLPIDGKNSLRTLVCAHYPRTKVESVLRALKSAGLIKSNNRGKWLPTTRHAVFPSLSAELLAHFTEGVARFIETMTRNVATRRKGDVLFERSSKVAKLPTSAGPAFRQFVNGQALAFLEAVDDWLEARVEGAKRSRESKCTAGVYAFAFLDDLPSRRGRAG